jgi:hypothetical protein
VANNITLLTKSISFTTNLKGSLEIIPLVFYYGSNFHLLNHISQSLTHLVKRTAD